MSDLTHVGLTWVEKQIEHWIRFGHVAEEKILDRRRRVVSFAPNSIFAHSSFCCDVRFATGIRPPWAKVCFCAAVNVP